MATSSFGGPWTEQKLEILRRYLDAYTTALKGQGFQLIYIDAFAGAGAWLPVRDILLTTMAISKICVMVPRELRCKYKTSLSTGLCSSKRIPTKQGN